MKKTLTIILLLFVVALTASAGVTINGQSQISGDVNVGGTITQTVDGVSASYVTKTTENITLYVSSIGSDENDCLSVGVACSTISEAMSRIPKRVEHTVLVSVGEGNFAGFDVSGFDVSRGTTLTIQGTLGIYGSGNSGTADGGSTTQCADSGQSWSANELRGKLAFVGGQYRVIRNNDATSFNTVGPFSATCSGQAYVVQEHKTIINDNSSLSGWRIHTTNNRCSRDSIIISDFATTGGTVGISIWVGDGYTWRRLHVTGAVYGGHMQVMTGTAIVEDSYFASNSYAGLVSVEFSGQLRAWRNLAYANSSMGYFLVGSGAFPSTNEYIYADGTTGSTYGALSVSGLKEFFVDGLYFDSNAGPGLAIRNIPVAKVENFTISSSGDSGIVVVGSSVLFDTGTITSSGEYGVEVDLDTASPTNFERGHSVVRFRGNVTISGSADSGIFAKNGAVLRLDNTDGSNSGGYGLELENGAVARVTGSTGITGATDDATIDGGGTGLTWATDFAGNGDIVSDTDNFCRIERRD